MSSIKQIQQDHYKGKVIQIKSIQPNKIEHENINGSLSLEDEKITIEKELQNIEAELVRLKEEKEKLLQATRQKIINEKENWIKEKELLIKEGYQEGYDLGFIEGKQASEEKYNKLITQINDLVDVTTKDYHTTLEQSEHIIVDLAIKTSEKIIKDKIVEDSKVFLEIVTEAIKEIKDQSIISIYLHPNNYELLMKQKEELVNALDGDTKLSIYVDQKMVENECLIEHPFGQIDASIDTQLQQIREVLHQVTMEKKS